MEGDVATPELLLLLLYLQTSASNKIKKNKNNNYTSLPLQTYLKLMKKQQKELGTLKKKHSKVGDCFQPVGNAERAAACSH